ncbi:MAG: DnaJ domain-containing protein, partial [Acetobacteraceae bacterium]|nr:DnaJ domain-containing protein [Acetobacteraceae bacterium]
TVDEAWQVLGLQPGASEEEIRAAHRRLMRAAHPDSGGSDWMAARVNQARDILLGRARRGRR